MFLYIDLVLMSTKYTERSKKGISKILSCASGKHWSELHFIKTHSNTGYFPFYLCNQTKNHHLPCKKYIVQPLCFNLCHVVEKCRFYFPNRLMEICKLTAGGERGCCCGFSAGESSKWAAVCSEVCSPTVCFLWHCSECFSLISHYERWTSSESGARLDD